MDFKRMRVLEKDIRVRRVDGKKTTWVWFYSSSRRGWVSYDRKVEDTACKTQALSKYNIQTHLK